MGLYVWCIKTAAHAARSQPLILLYVCTLHMYIKGPSIPQPTSLLSTAWSSDPRSQTIPDYTTLPARMAIFTITATREGAFIPGGSMAWAVPSSEPGALP